MSGVRATRTGDASACTIQTSSPRRIHFRPAPAATTWLTRTIGLPGAIGSISFQTTVNLRPSHRSKPPPAVATHSSPFGSAKIAWTGNRESLVSDSPVKPLKRTPSKRTSPSAVPIHSQPSDDCFTERTMLLGRPSPDCQIRTRKRLLSIPAADAETTQKKSTSIAHGSRMHFERDMRR